MNQEKESNNKKIYYSISEVCQKTGLEQHVLRYWETEFSQLKPKKNRAGNRAYKIKEIKIIEYIKYLLYEEQYTIQGAKKKMASLKELNMPDWPQLKVNEQKEKLEKKNSQLEEVKNELKSLLSIIKSS
ncbi:MAG: MerR family transcriptional regulator [bacterium]